MRLAIGILLTLIGGAVVLIGLFGALSELVTLYSSALNDAMADGPEGKAVGANMMRWAILGAVGAPFLIVGAVILKISLISKLLRGRSAKIVAPRSSTVIPQWEPAPKPRPAAPAQHPGTPTPRKPAAAAKPQQSQPRRDDLGESGGNRSER